jgi:allantoate deiminase
VSLDVRSPTDAVRAWAVAQIRSAATQPARRHGCKVAWEIVQETPAVNCVTGLSRSLAEAAQRVTRRRVPWLPSGAGHDAAVMAAVTPVAMLFVRCKGGISHHPDESVDFNDVAFAIDTMGEFLTRLGAAYEKRA